MTASPGKGRSTSESRTLSLLPWQVSLAEFTRSAIEVGPDGACCVFVVDPSIPPAARSGYASLVMAYSRADEPVCVLAEQETFANRLFRDNSYGRNVSFLIAVALLERRPRVAGCKPLGLCLGKRDIASRKCAHLAFEKSRGGAVEL